MLLKIFSYFCTFNKTWPVLYSETDNSVILKYHKATVYCYLQLAVN